VTKTGRLGAGLRRGGSGELPADRRPRTSTNLAFDALDAPVVVVGARNHITPAPELEDLFFPQASWIVDAIHERILPLPGHVPTSNFTDGELVRRTRLGV